MTRTTVAQPRDSRFGWFDSVPSNWEVSRVRKALTEKRIKNEGQVRDEYLSLVSGVGVIPYAEKGAMGNKKSDDLSNCKLVEKGDFVINSMNFLIGGFGRSAYQGVCSSVYVVAEPKQDEFNPRYLMRVFQVNEFQRHVGRLGKGIMALRMSIGWDELKNQPIPKPPMRVQEAIANFLDDKTAQIETLIAEKERLLDVLKHQHFEAIDHAVLGGDTSQAGPRLRGLEVLGALPEGWSCSRMKYEIDYLTSGSRGWADFYSDTGALFVRIGNLTRDSLDLDLSDIQRVELPASAEGQRGRLRPGDLLISITAYLGSVAVVSEEIEEAYVSQHVSLARPNSLRAVPKWLGYIVLSSVGRTFFELQAYGGTKVQLSLEDIRELPVPLPSKAVQLARISNLEKRLSRLGELTGHVEGHLARLREYRSSLISAAVTGQIDLEAYKNLSV